jgi:acetoacetate decarboxylase
MGFVKTPEEVARLRELLREARFVGGEMLAASYRTDPEAVVRVLPPGLEPAAEPVARVVVGRWRSNCVGDFSGGALYVDSRRDGIEATYVVSMFMDRDVPTFFGRDLYGEPKKIARVALFRQADRASGFIERGGVKLIEIDARLGEDRGPSAGTSADFNVKAMLAADGQGLDGDATITLAEYRSQLFVNRPADAALQVRGTAHDPLGDLPVLEVLGASYSEGDMATSCRAIGTIPGADFFPYALGRHDDYTLLDTEVAAGALAAG